MKRLTGILIRITLALAIICIISIALAFFVKFAPIVTIVRLCIFLSLFFVLVFGSLISLLLYQLGNSSEGRLTLVERRIAIDEADLKALKADVAILKQG